MKKLLVLGLLAVGCGGGCKDSFLHATQASIPDVCKHVDHTATVSSSPGINGFDVVCHCPEDKK